MTELHVKIDDAAAQLALDSLARAGGNLRPVMHDIAEVLASETEANFAAQGRPRWTALKNPSERRQGGQILQDSGQLAASITTEVSDTEAVIGTNKVYAAIHQFGGKIERGAAGGTVRLRTDAKGQLLRQGDKGRAANLAVFAGAHHKRAVERSYSHEGYDIDMPARPYLPITADGDLQPEAREEVLDTVMRHLMRAAGA